MENHELKEKSYFCHGCEHFTAMIMDDDNVGLIGASVDKLEKPRLFVLTFCTHKENPDGGEGNTKQKNCPLEKSRNN